MRVKRLKRVVYIPERVQKAIAKVPKTIRDRTAAGVGSNGKPLKARKDGTPVDFSGPMLSSLRILRVRRNGRTWIWTIGVAIEHRAQARALHRGNRRMRARPWLGLARRERAALVAEIQRSGVIGAK